MNVGYCACIHNSKHQELAQYCLRYHTHIVSGKKDANPYVAEYGI